jgi:DNA polymerase family A
MMNDWRDLPFPEIWAVDTEYYPGSGLANGGRDGDPITPLCLVALEMRSGRLIRLWQDEFGPSPPYSIGPDSVVIGYMASAELGTHLALNWSQPANVLDPYIEFRHCTNDGSIEPEDRKKGFYGLDGALRYFLEDAIDSAHKKEMRDRIIQGPPYTFEEAKNILDYCEEDARALARLVPHIISTIRSLPHALFRGKFQWDIALQERRGLSVDLPLLTRFRTQWDAIRCDLVIEKDFAGIYKIVDGRPHWRKQQFADYLQRSGLAPVWPRLASGAFDEADDAFKEMEGRYPQIKQLRQLRYTLSKLKINDLAVGSDGRNRCVLGAYGTKTARNAPSNSKYIFGPAKWLRFLITPPPGRALVHRDYSQQEVRIAAVKSGDTALLHACESGDVYLDMAIRLGLAPDGATADTHPGARALFKTAVLGINYGLQGKSLAAKTGLTLFEACEIITRLRARFHVFEDYSRNVQDHAGLNLEIGTPFGWYMQCPPAINPRVVRNFPIQSTAAEIYHVAVMLAERRGIELVASIHDALIAEVDARDAKKVSAALDRAMRDASRLVLGGYELPTEEQIVQPGRRFFDKNGADMWGTIMALLNKLEARRA